MMVQPAAAVMANEKSSSVAAFSVRSAGEVVWVRM